MLKRYDVKKDENGKWRVWDAETEMFTEFEGTEQEVRTKVEQMNKADEPTKSATQFTTVHKGLKAVGSDTLEGYGVVFDSTDLYGQRFTKDTEFHFSREPSGMPVLWEHGLDGLDSKIGVVKQVTVDAVGHWYQIKLDRSNKYFEAIKQLAKDGRLGLSTGTSPHMMKSVGNKITEFGTLECSVTICPAEPGTLGTQIKHAKPVISSDSDTLQKGTNMEEDRLVALETQMKALFGMVETTLATIKNAPGAKGTVYSDSGEGDTNKNTKTFADFLISVQRHDDKRLKSIYGSTKGMDSTSGETGGYTVPTEFLPQLLRIEPEMNVFMEQYGAFVIPMERETMDIPALNQGGDYEAGQSQYFGGVKFVGVGQGKNIPETEATFEEITLRATKQAGYAKLTNELADDNGVGLERILVRLFGEALAYRKMWLFLRGTGIDEPLGILTSNTIVTSTLSATPTLAEFHLMAAPLPPGCYNRAYWFVHPFLQYHMTSLVTGFVPYQQNLQRTPFGQPFNGRPVVVTDMMPATLADGGIGLFDIGYYGVGERRGVEIAYSTEAGFLQDEIYWRVKQRFDGRPLITSTVNISGGNVQSPFVRSTT